MHLILILVVVAAVVASENAAAGPVPDAAGRLLIAAGAVVLLGLFAVGASRAIARGLRTDPAGYRPLLRRFSYLRRIHVVLWLAAAALILFGLDWVRIVRFNWQLDRAWLLDDLLVLAPVLLPLVVSWAAFYDVERAVRLGPGRDDTTERIATRGQYVALHARHYLGILLVPVLGLLAIQDAVQLFAPASIKSECQAVILPATLGGLFLLFPAILRRLWQTRPLPPGPLRSRLEAVAERCRFRARDILVWHTNSMVVNAAVAGFVRPLRYVFLTDALLEQLTDDEIEAVFSHEVGHVRQHHLVFRLMSMLVPLSVWLLVGQLFPQPVERFERWVSLATVGSQAEVGLLFLAVMGLYAFIVFGYYSRLLEHQADLFACRALDAKSGRSAVETYARALEKLAAGNGQGRNTGGWQHASIARRVRFLDQLSLAPIRELRFRRWIGLLDALLVGIVLSPVICQILLG